MSVVRYRQGSKCWLRAFLQILQSMKSLTRTIQTADVFRACLNEQLNMKHALIRLNNNASDEMMISI